MRPLSRFVLCGIVAAAAAAVLPPLAVVMTGAQLPSRHTAAIALLGMCTGGAWIAIAAWWQRHHRAIALPMVALVAIVVVFAGVVARDPERNWDYINAYELPAQQLLVGLNPHENGEQTNPPTWAQATGLLATALAHTVLLGAPAEDLWFWVFYIYQVVQLALVAVLFALCYGVARTSGSGILPASLITAIALLACSPLHEAFLLNQINLLVLVIMMLAVMLTLRHPAWAGAIAGFGGAVKLYPLALWLYWAVSRRWRPIIASALMLGVIIAAGWTFWAWYFDYLIAFERPTVVRDASLHGTISSFVRIGGGAFGLQQNAGQIISFTLWIAADAMLLFWLWRDYSRRRPSAEGDASGNSGIAWPFVAALPLLFPLGWVHHYLLVLPLAINHVASRATITVMAAVGILLALVLPAFDTFPLGVTRPLGTLLLLAAHRDVTDE